MPLSRDELIDRYIKLELYLGRTPKVRDDRTLAIWALKQFNSWAALQTAVVEHKQKLKTSDLHAYKTYPPVSDLLAEYNKLKKKLGRQPKSTEASKLACKAFGHPELQSWSALVVMAGDTPAKHTKHKKANHLTKEYIVNRYHTLKETLGRQPLTRDDWELKYLVEHCPEVGSWKALLAEVGAFVKCDFKTWTREELIAQYNELKETLGRVPNSRNGSKLACRAKACPELGSWMALRTAAGDSVKKPSGRSYKQPEYTKETLTKIMAGMFLLLGYFPPVEKNMWNFPGKVQLTGIPTPCQFTNMFGSMSAARSAALAYLEK